MLRGDLNIVGSHPYCVCRPGAERYIKRVFIYLEKCVLSRKISCGDHPGQIAKREGRTRLINIIKIRLDLKMSGSPGPGCDI